MSLIGRAANELRADSWQRTGGVPLGASRFEYRNLFAIGVCIASYIYEKSETMDLGMYQAALRKSLKAKP